MCLGSLRRRGRGYLTAGQESHEAKSDTKMCMFVTITDASA
jgi:hypothetical protein